MRSLTYPLIFFSAVAMFSACPSEPASNGGVSVSPSAAESPKTEFKDAPEAEKSPETAELPGSDLKPGDITDEPVDATELRNAIFQDPDAWKGKEVRVKGDYNGHSTSTTSSGTFISMNIRNAEKKNVGTCEGTEAPPADVKERRTDRVFTGKVSRIVKAFEQFELKECKITG